MKTICCVLRSGGDFRPEHVWWLKKQCAEHMPDWGFRVWSDVPMLGSTPLRTSWPKWWAKMEIFSYNLTGPVLVVDIDTVFVKPFEIHPNHVNSMLMIRDPYRDGLRGHERLAGGFSYIPVWAQRRIWDMWIKNPNQHMRESNNDDQVFYTKYFKDDVVVIQDHYVDQVVSYKYQAKPLGLRPENRVVFFHGLPRPWNVVIDWIPQLENYDGCPIERACG